MNHIKYHCPICKADSFLPEYMGQFCPVCNEGELTDTRLELVKAVNRREQALKNLKEAIG